MRNDSSTPAYNSKRNLTHSGTGIHWSSVNEFYMADSNNSISENGSCFVFTRSPADKTGNSIVKTIPADSCSKQRHVLCSTRAMKVRLTEKLCFEKPLTLGPPNMVSNHLTFELCQLACSQLDTNSAILQTNKCYCINLPDSFMFKSYINSSIHRRQNCGKPCPGMFFPILYTELLLSVIRNTL